MSYNTEKDLLILDKNTLEKQKQLRYKELEDRGIPEPERSRAVQAEFVDYPNPEYSIPWPGPVTGADLAGNINLDLIPASKEPPVIQPNTDKTEPFPTPNRNPYPNNPTPDPNSVGINSHTYNITNFPAAPSTNWVATGNEPNSEPPSVGVEGFNSHKAIPEWRYPIEQSQMVDISIPPIIIEPSGQFNEAVMPEKKEKKKSLLKRLAPWLAILGAGFSATALVNDYLDDAPEELKARNRYFTHTPMELIAEFTLSSSHTGKDVCDDYAGKTFNLLDVSNRPILPSEGKGYVELTHPHCSCVWKIEKKPKTGVDTLTRKQQSEFGAIESHINKAAKDHTLHTVKPDGSLSKRTRGTNPIKESIGKIRHQMRWLSDEYLTKAKETAMNNNGVLYLIRAATETITDHRSEGEQYRRKLAGKELNAMARTAVGHGMDINHNPDYATGGIIADSEYDNIRKEIQMLVIETDPQINQYIADGSISAVSINGGNPRTQSIEPCFEGCTGPECELCNVPQGVVLAEIDGIGMTWVVTAPQGIIWRGNHIPNAIPGIKDTVIELL